MEDLNGNEAILVVHPLRGVREATVRTVRKFGFRTIEAASAIQAQSLVEIHPGIRILIMEFPDLEFDGLQTALWFAEKNPRVKVLLASSRIWNLGYQPREPGQIVFCTTPVTAHDLARLVRPAPT